MNEFVVYNGNACNAQQLHVQHELCKRHRVRHLTYLETAMIAFDDGPKWTSVLKTIFSITDAFIIFHQCIKVLANITYLAEHFNIIFADILHVEFTENMLKFGMFFPIIVLMNILELKTLARLSYFVNAAFLTGI